MWQEVREIMINTSLNPVSKVLALNDLVTKTEKRLSSANLEAWVPNDANFKSELLNGMEAIGNQLPAFAENITQKIRLWKHQQQQKLCGFFIPDEIKLNQVQIYMEHLLDLNRNSDRVLHSMTSKAGFQNDVEYIKRVQNKFQANFRQLLEQCLIVEVQPPQVLLTDAWIRGDPITVSLLASKSIPNISEQFPPTLGIWIIREKDAMTWSQSDKVSGKIPKCLSPREDEFLVQNSPVTMKYCQNRERYFAEFSGLRLKKELTRETRENRENSSPSDDSSGPSTQNQQSLPETKILVAEEKLYMFFQTEINGNLLSTTSLPIVLTTNSSQYHLAEWTVMWGNAFSKVEQNPWEVTPTAVSWEYLAALISARIWKKTGRSLKLKVEDLKELLINFVNNSGDNGFTLISTTDELVSRETFCKTPTYKTSFWHWMHASLKSVQNNGSLLQIWKRGYHYGFVSRDRCHEMLQTCVPGTFLLRFSETCRGVTVASFVVRQGLVEDLRAGKGDEIFEIIQNNAHILRFLYLERVVENPVVQILGIRMESIFSEFFPKSKAINSKKRVSGFSPIVRKPYWKAALIAQPAMASTVVSQFPNSTVSTPEEVEIIPSTVVNNIDQQQFWHQGQQAFPQFPANTNGNVIPDIFCPVETLMDVATNDLAREFPQIHSMHLAS